MKFELKNDNRGLTLMELLVGVAILAVIITPLLHVYVTGANTARKNKLYSDATLAAQNIVEYIEATDMKMLLKGKKAENSGEDKGKYIFMVDDKEDEEDEEDEDYSVIENAFLECIRRVDSEFDANITIEPADSASIPISNQMDAVFAMQEVDAIAHALFISEGEPVTELSRYITIDVDYVSEEDASPCKVTVTFEYEGTVVKTYFDSYRNEHTESISFKYPIVNEMNVTPRSEDRDAFAVYLFFKAYSWENTYFEMKKTVINNNTNYDFNVFLVDVGDYTKDIIHEVDYKPAKPKGVANLFTNMGNMGKDENSEYKGKITYKVYKSPDSIWQMPEKVTPGLVQTDAINRIYNITVEIYKDGKKLADMSSTKLDYSAKYEGGSE